MNKEKNKIIVHLYALNADEAKLKVMEEYSTLVVGEVYLDVVWCNPCRWCVEVIRGD